MTTPRYASFNGTIVPYADAKIHVLTPGLKYAASVFEGVRGYWNETRRALLLFRLGDHLDRLRFSMKVMRFATDLTSETIERATIEVIRANELREDTYVRIVAWIDGSGELSEPGPVGWAVTAVPRGQNAHGATGVHCAVSSWRRVSDVDMPTRVKAAANYSNGRLASMQSRLDGYNQVLFLTKAGHVAESPGSCFFMVRHGRLVTPGVTSSILESITRATVIELARELDNPVVERDVDRTEVYAAEEAFFCGTSHEIQPVLSLDRHPIGAGAIGAITRALQQRYFSLVRGNADAHRDWLTPVNA